MNTLQGLAHFFFPLPLARGVKGQLYPLSEIVSVALQLQLAHRRWDHMRLDAITRGIGQRVIRRFELQHDLLLRIARTGPTHQGIGPLGLGCFELKQPIAGPGPAGLHGVFRALINAC